MLSRMKLHSAENVAGIVKRKDSFTTAKITAAVKNSKPHNEAIVATNEGLMVFNTVLIVWLVYRVVTIHRMVEHIGNVFFSEELTDELCPPEEEGRFMLVEPGDTGAIEGTTGPYLAWDNGDSGE